MDDVSIGGKWKRASPTEALGLEPVATNDVALARSLSLSGYSACYSGYVDLSSTDLPYVQADEPHPSGVYYLEENPVICTAKRGVRSDAKRLQPRVIVT